MHIVTDTRNKSGTNRSSQKPLSYYLPAFIAHRPDCEKLVFRVDTAAVPPTIRHDLYAAPKQNTAMTSVAWRRAIDQAIASTDAIAPPVHVYLDGDGLNSRLFVKHKNSKAFYQIPSENASSRRAVNNTLTLDSLERLVYAFDDGDYVVDSCELHAFDRATGAERSRLPLVHLGCPSDSARLARKPHQCSGSDREWPLERQLDAEQCDPRCSQLQLLTVPSQVLLKERSRLATAESENSRLRITCTLKLHRAHEPQENEPETHPTALNQLISRLPQPLCRV